MFNPIKAYRQWRDRKFYERVDRVYFHADGHGNKEMQGNFFIDGNLAVSDSSSCFYPEGNPFKKEGVS